MIPHKNEAGLTEWFEHPNPVGDKTLVQAFIQNAGLGNQLMEFSGGYTLAKKLGMHFRWSWSTSKLREFGLAHWGFAETHLPDAPIVSGRIGQGGSHVSEKLEEILKDSIEKVCGISTPFQDEACFAGNADEIRKLFKLPAVKLPNPKGTTPVGVQVRRGDYVGHPRLDVVTKEYFLDAMDVMGGEVKKPHFIIVSDDPEFCRQAFGSLDGVTVMPAQTPLEGLRTLSSCKAHIISNSTFGWWGAWLGENGPVITPDPWYLVGNYGKWDPVPKRWGKLPVRGVIQPEKKPYKISVVARSVAPLPAPGVERAIVYPWHADFAKWQELRYSLRSVEENFEDKKCPIYIYGTRRPAFIQQEHPRVQYRGAFTYAEALTGGAQSAEKVLWMNDDILMLKPVTWADCEVPYYMHDIPADFLEKADAAGNPWREGCMLVLRKLREMGITDHKRYSTHLPYVWERERSLQVFEKFGVFEKFPMELAYFHLFPEGSRLAGSVRAKNINDKEALFLPYVDTSLTPAFKRAVMDRFPKPGSWEIGAAF